MTKSPATNPWLITPRPSLLARLRLFCFHYAGGGASIFRTWPDYLPADVEVVAIQSPGREQRFREPPFTNAGALVRTLADALAPLLDRPFVFFGHSMGALVSFELARELRRRGLPQPQKLLVSGRPAPQLPSPERDVYNLPEPEFLDELRRLNGTPEELFANPELLQLLLPMVRADFAVLGTYVYVDEPPLDLPISAFGGLQDDHATREELDLWRAQTSRAFGCWVLPGDHFFLNTNRSQLMPLISTELMRLIGA